MAESRLDLFEPALELLESTLDPVLLMSNLPSIDPFSNKAAICGSDSCITEKIVLYKSSEEVPSIENERTASAISSMSASG